MIDCDFLKSEFHNEANFQKVKLTRCIFTKVKFQEEADFKEANFYGKNIFLFTLFSDRGAFWGAYFEQNPVFYNLILGKDSHLYFGNLNRIDIEKNKSYKEFRTHVEERMKKLKIEIPNIENETEERYKERIQKEDEKIKIKTFSFTNTIINGRLDFNDDNIMTLDINGSIVVGTLSRILFTPKCANWETATLLKHEELKIDNLIRALEYKAVEKDLYENELWRQLNNKHWVKKIICIIICFIPSVLLLPIILPLSIIKLFITYGVKKTLYIIVSCILHVLALPITLPLSIIEIVNYNTKEIPLTKKSGIKLITEWLSLWVGKVSNNHGQSWVQGILFTTIVWFVCFGMFFINLPEDNAQIPISVLDWVLKEYENLTSVQSFFSLMIEYFNPTNYEILIKFFDTQPPIDRYIELWGSFWYLLGKALIPYGAFEVVQAFRKYNKID